ncbi:hypothetical protein JCM19992_18670 [Thermostilla marina]
MSIDARRFSDAAQRMAANLEKVEQIAESLDSKLDAMIAATCEDDLVSLAELGDKTARYTLEHGHHPMLTLLAHRVADEAKRGNAVGAKRAMIRLIGTAGRVGDK